MLLIDRKHPQRRHQSRPRQRRCKRAERSGEPLRMTERRVPRVKRATTPISPRSFAFNWFPCRNPDQRRFAQLPCFQWLPYSNPRLLYGSHSGVVCPYTPGAKHRALLLAVPMLPDGATEAASRLGRRPGGLKPLRYPVIQAICGPQESGKHLPIHI
jgi:hypothetical protein